MTVPRVLSYALLVAVFSGCGGGTASAPTWHLGDWRIDPQRSLAFAKEHPRFDTTEERALALLEERAETMSMTVTTTSVSVTIGSRAQAFDVTVESASDDAVVMRATADGESVGLTLEKIEGGIRLHTDESDDMSIYAWVPRRGARDDR